MVAEQADHVHALLGDDQRAAVALDVADLQQALDDRRARGRRADPGFLHRLAQLLVVDELAGRLHRVEQRAVGVAPRRLGLLGVGRDPVDLRLLALLELRQLLVGALVVVVGVGLRRRRRPTPSP